MNANYNNNERVERFGRGLPFVPYVEIVEQPASRGQRFRYECEGRSAGSIPGATSSLENKTYPAIRIVGYEGLAVILVSCVTKDFPHKPHPHHIVGKEGCSRGVFSVKTVSSHAPITFPNLGIQCVKKKDIQDALKLRKQLRVDPFSTGFDHINCPAKIDLNVVRLCFQVYIVGSQPEKFNVPLQPVVTDPVYDKKAVADLTICKLSHDRAPVSGGLEMILLCEKVVREDIQVRFFEEIDDSVAWERYGEFSLTDVHKQYAISLKTPKYYRQDVEHPVQIFVQLKRPSDDAYSEPIPFKMDPLPRETAEEINYRKRKDVDDNQNISIGRNVQAKTGKQTEMLQRPIRSHFDLVKTGQPEHKYFRNGEIPKNNASSVKCELAEERVLRRKIPSEDVRYSNTSPVSIAIKSELSNGMANDATTDIKTDMAMDMKNELTTGKTIDVGSSLIGEIPMETSGELSSPMTMQLSPQLQNPLQSQMQIPRQMQTHVHVQSQVQRQMPNKLATGQSTERMATEMQTQVQTQTSSNHYRRYDQYVPQQSQCTAPVDQNFRYSNATESMASNAITNGEPVGLERVMQVTPQPEGTKQSTHADCEYGPLNSSLSQLDSEELAVFGTMLSEKLWTGLSISDPDLDNHLEPNNGNDGARSSSTPFPEPMNLQSVYKPPIRNDTDLMIT